MGIWDLAFLKVCPSKHLPVSCRAPHSTALRSCGTISKHICAKRRSAESRWAPLHCPTFPQIPPRGHHVEGSGRVEPVPRRRDAPLAAKFHSTKGEDCGSYQFPVSKLGLLRTSCQGGPLPPHSASPQACCLPCRARCPSPTLPFIPACNSLARRAGKGAGSK